MNKFTFDKESVYLNYASTSYPKSAIALDSFYRSLTSLPGGSRQNLLNRSIDACRERVGRIIGIDAEYVFFTQGATLGLNQVIFGFMNKLEVVAFDNRSHNAVIRPCYSFKHCMADIYDENDHLIQDNLIELAAKSPRLLCLSHVSNVNGSIYPVEQIIDFFHLHSPSTSILVDASQSAGNLLLSPLKKADFIVFPSHKHLHSLPGAAVIIAKKRLEPLIFGGTGSNSMKAETLGLKELFAEVGTPNLPAIQALVDSLEYSESMFNEHRNLENILMQELIDGVAQIEGLKLIGRLDIQNRVGIVALKTEYGSAEHHWAPFLQSQKIFVRGGLQCSPLHHQQLGLSEHGSLRLSLGWGSKEQDVKKVIMALKEFSKVAKRVLNVSNF